MRWWYGGVLWLVACDPAPGTEAECPTGFVPGEGRLCLQEADTDVDADADADADADTDADTEPPPGDDGDGDGVTAATDCDDADPAVFPGAVDVCGDGVDANCAPGACRWSGTHTLPDFEIEAHGSYGIQVADLTGDGADDLVVHAFNGRRDAFFVVRNPQRDVPIADQADFVVSGFTDFDAYLGNPTYFDLGDLTGDGVTDLLVGAYEGAYVIPGPIDRDVNASTRLHVLRNASPIGAAPVSLGDFDGDGQLDAAVYASAGLALVNGPVTDHRNLNNAWATLQSTNSGNSRAVELGGDYDGDGADDVATAMAGELRVMDGNLLPGLYDLVRGYDHRVANSYASSVSAGDVDGDGIDDLAVGSGRCCGPGVSVSLFAGGLPYSAGAEAGTFVVDSAGTGNLDGEKVDISHDLDGDGWNDLVFTDQSAGLARVFYGPLAGRYAVDDADAVLVGYTTNTSWELFVGDVDLDGATDVAMVYHVVPALFYYTPYDQPGRISVHAGGAD